MNRYDEMNLRQKFEVDRLSLLAGRLLSLSGARTMVIALGSDGSPEIWCSSGWLSSAFDFVGDAIVNADDGEERLLADLVQGS